MKKYSASFVILFFFFIQHAVSQTTLSGMKTAENFQKNVYGIGLAVSPMSGLGFSFRTHMPTKLSYQVTGFIIKLDSNVTSSIGAEVQYDIVRVEGSRFYIGGGLSYFFNGYDANKLSGPFRFGAGIGGEFPIKGSLHGSGGLMVTIFSDNNILPLPQLGLHYYFY